MASLGFEKSYRETIVLMTRSYLSKLSSIGSSESRTLAPEANTERVEVCISLYYVIRLLCAECPVKWMLMVQLHSRHFLQDFFLLPVVLRVLNYGRSIDIDYSLYVQMLACLPNLRVAGSDAFESLLHGAYFDYL